MDQQGLHAAGCSKCTVRNLTHLREDGYDVLLAGPRLLLSCAAGMHQNSKFVCTEMAMLRLLLYAIIKGHWAMKPWC